MVNGWTLGSATAIGLGVGVALSASTGPAGLLIGLAAAIVTFVGAREVDQRRR